MAMKIGLSPKLASLLPGFQDVREGGRFGVTIRLASEDDAFWLMHEGRLNIITVKTPAAGLDLVNRLYDKYEIEQPAPSREEVRRASDALKE